MIYAYYNIIIIITTQVHPFHWNDDDDDDVIMLSGGRRNTSSALYEHRNRSAPVRAKNPSRLPRELYTIYLHIYVYIAL